MTHEEKKRADNSKNSDIRPVRHVLAVILILILPIAGIVVLLFGIGDYNSATFEKTETVEGNMFFLIDNNATVIKEMKVVLDEKLATTQYPAEGWLGVVIDFTTMGEHMYLSLDIPQEISHVYVHNYSRCDIFWYNWKYNTDSDSSEISMIYNSSSTNEGHFRILFDWKAFEKIAYDKKRVTIPFDNPYFGKPLFSDFIPIASFYLPKIERLVIQAESAMTLDSSLTTPQPSYLYFSATGETSATWVFDADRETSSVQAVFQNPALSAEKENLVFRAGLYIAFGTSMIIGGIREILSATRKYTLKK